MRPIYYFVLPAVVFLVSLISYFTSLFHLWPLNFCFSNQCWFNLIEYFSFAFQSFAACVLLTTLAISAYRIQLTNEQLINQNNQLIQQRNQMLDQKRALNTNTYYHFRSEFTDFFAYIDDQPNYYFQSAQFRFKDKFKRLFPRAHVGNLDIDGSIKSWLINDVKINLSKLGKNLDTTSVEAYKISSYAETFKSIFYTYEELFYLEFNIENEIFDDSISLPFRIFLSDINPESRLQSGKTLEGIFRDIFFVASKLNEFIGVNYYSIEEIKEMRSQIGFFSLLVKNSIEWHSNYEKQIEHLRQSNDPRILNNNHSGNHIIVKIQSLKGAEREIFLNKLDFEKRIPFARELKELLLENKNH